jgi:rSAM/selenodomain-associated transferase 2
MKISVIIPALNEGGNVLSSLLSVRDDQGNFEIIVVDGGSTDNTAEKARAHAVVISSGRGRAIQMNAGARKASGDALLFLHADSTLDPSALVELRTALKDRTVVGGTFSLRFDVDHPILRFYTFFTRFNFRYFHYGDQGIFVRRAVFEQLGGFKQTPLMEDIDFLRRLRRMGRVELLRVPVTTSARRFIERGIIRQQLLNTALVSLYSLGAKPETLAKWYRARDEQSEPHSREPQPFSSKRQRSGE